jgi:hypothetical protein
VAAISDSAGIFTGATLDAFNAMQVLIARDGDLVGAQRLMLEACRSVIVHKTTLIGGTTDGRVVEKRANQP